MGMGIRAQNEPWYRGVAIAIYQLGNDVQKGTVVKELICEELKDGELISTALTLSQTQAQVLIDDLWNCGLRPSEGSGSAGQLASTQKHLEDFRKLVFDHLIHSR